VKTELEARRKEVAIRSRRLPSAFARAALGALQECHAAPHITLLRVRQECQKVNLGPDGGPSSDRPGAAPTDEEKSMGLRSQDVWPKLTVEGEMKRDTPDPGQVLLSYYTALRTKAGGLDVEGFKVFMDPTQLDARYRFTITFTPQAPGTAPAGEG
jgi:hypothetical protein